MKDMKTQEAAMIIIIVMLAQFVMTSMMIIDNEKSADNNFEKLSYKMDLLIDRTK